MPGKRSNCSRRHAGVEYPGTPRGSSEVVPIRLANGQSALTALEPWHGNQVVVYSPDSRAGMWRRNLLDDSLKEGHALVVANLDSDSDEEIVAAGEP